MTCKNRPRYDLAYDVFGGTLNLAQSINHQNFVAYVLILICCIRSYLVCVTSTQTACFHCVVTFSLDKVMQVQRVAPVWNSLPPSVADFSSFTRCRRSLNNVNPFTCTRFMLWRRVCRFVLGKLDDVMRCAKFQN